MNILEKIKSKSDVVPVRNKDFKNAIKVFGQRLAVKLEHCVKGFESFVGKIAFAVDFDNVREKSRGYWVAFGFEINEKVINKREVSRATKFENQSEVRRVRV